MEGADDRHGTLARLTMESDLHHALERGELFLEYRPQVALGSGAVTCVEALLRWERDGRGRVGPAEFAPLLEENGLIVAVGNWVLRTACGQCRDWRDEGLDDMRVGVNVSQRRLYQGDLDTTLGFVLGAAGGGSGPPLLESVTPERCRARPPARGGAPLPAIGGAHVRVAVDDFGTGYSALGALGRVPADVLKIDRAFVAGVDADRRARVLAQAVVTLGKGLGMEVVAEGVETPRQLEILREMGCDAAQGYLLARPLPVGEVAAFVRDHRPPG